MRSTLFNLALVVLFLCSNAAGAEGPSARDVPRYELKGPAIGWSKPDTIAYGGCYPMDRPYSRFTEKEKAVFRSMYQDMPDSDEPPFPENGLKEIVESLSRLAGRRNMRENVSIFVTVDATGAATDIDLVEYSDIENAKAVGYVLVQAKYKPAKCGGEPCTMQWPFRVTFSAE